MDSPKTDGLALRDYVAVLRRRLWVIVVVVLVATVSAYVLSWLHTPQYEASTELLYEQQINVADPLTGGSSLDTNALSLEVDNMGTLVTSPQVRAIAVQLAPSLAGAHYGVTAVPKTDTSQSSTTVAVSGATVTAQSPKPAVAALAANTYAQAIIQLRQTREKASIAQAIKVIQTELQAYDTSALRRSADYILLQQRLHDLKILDATVTGDFTVVAPAVAPSAPFSPRPLHSGMLGLGVGLFVGIGLAFLLQQFDNSVQSREEVSQLLGLPLLGQIPVLSKAEVADGHVVTLADPASHGAEAFRMVRSNLEFVTVDGDNSTIMLTSCLQGEGKTLTLCNLAVTLALAGKRVVVVDCDLRRPRVHSVFGLPNKVGVSTVVSGQSKLVESVQSVAVTPAMAPAQNGGGLGSAEAPVEFAFVPEPLAQPLGVPKPISMYVLTAGPIPPNPGEVCASRGLATMLANLGKQPDVVLIDTPAMLAVGDTAALANKVDGLLFLVDMHAVGRSTLREAVDRLEQMPCRKLGVIVARQAHGDGHNSHPYYYKYGEDGSRLRKRLTTKA